MVKVQKIVNLEIDEYNWIEKNIENFSEYIRNKIREDMENEDHKKGG